MARRGRVRSRTTKVQILHAERRAVAMSLRKQGASYRLIGETMRGMDPEERAKLGISDRYAEAQAHRDVSRELQRLLNATSEDAESVRRLELERLDAMLAGVWKRAEAGQLDAINTVLSLQARRARYTSGLEVPQKQELVGPNDGPVAISFIEIVKPAAE